MNKETAVEWFVKELFKKIDYIQVDPKLIEQALAMEKEQIVNAWYDCKLSIVDKKPMDAEDYYNETYGGEQ
jgi:hypothetical protein